MRSYSWLSLTIIQYVGIITNIQAVRKVPRRGGWPSKDGVSRREGISVETQTEARCPRAIEGILQATNQHDLDALAACFDADYQSEFPAHPGRAFGGHEQLRQNWSRIFSAVPDLEATLLRCCAEGDTAWAEWAWAGTFVDGTAFRQRGVTIHGVRDEKTSW